MRTLEQKGCDWRESGYALQQRNRRPEGEQHIIPVMNEKVRTLCGSDAGMSIQSPVAHSPLLELFSSVVVFYPMSELLVLFRHLDQVFKSFLIFSRPVSGAVYVCNANPLVRF